MHRIASTLQPDAFRGWAPFADTPFAGIWARQWDDSFLNSASDALGWTALHHACAIGWEDGIKRALNGGVPADAQALDGCTALDLAILAGASSIIRLLLARPEVVALERKRMYGAGLTAARRAAERMDVETMIRLKEQGCLYASEELAILFLSALVVQQTGHELFVCSAGEELQFEPIIKERLGFIGNLSLDPEVARLLGLKAEWEGGHIRRISTQRFEVAPGIPPNPPIAPVLRPLPLQAVSEPIQVAIHRGPDPAHEAILLDVFARLCRLGGAPVVAWMAQHLRFWEVDPNESAFVHAVRHDDITALLAAAIPEEALHHPPLVEAVWMTLQRGATTAARLLLGRGMPANAAPFLVAVVESGLASPVAQLVALGVDPNHRANGTTPLVEAVRRMRPRLIDALLQEGADPNLAGDPAQIRSTPLGATQCCDLYQRGEVTNVINRLIEAGADVNQQDRAGRTMLHLETYSDVIRTLVAAGARLDLQDAQGYTALQCSMFGRPSSAAVFLSFGRGLDQRDDEGNTLVHLACFTAWPSIEIFLSLQRWGLDLSAPNDAGLTPLQRASHPLGRGPAQRSSRKETIAALQSLFQS